MATDDMRNRLAELDSQVAALLSGSRGARGALEDADISACQLWHRGVAEVQVGLTILARLVARAAREADNA